MAKTIKIKRRTSGTTAPSTSDIAAGELAFVEASQKLYYRDAADNIREIGGSGAFLKSNENDTMDGNLTVTGDLTVQGTTTQVDSTTVSIADANMELASTNNNDASNGVTTDAVDFGVYGNFNKAPGAANTTAYGGFFRDASDSGKFKFYTDLEAEPTSTVNTSGTGYAAATVVADTFEGNLAGAPTITAATVATSLDMNGTELILDVDGDTSITADSDDQIDIKIGGSNRININPSAIIPSSNGNLNLGTGSNRFGDVYASGTSRLNTVLISGGAIANTTIGATVPNTGAFTSLSASSQITSTLATGTAPMVIASTTAVSNLNADLLDGQHAPSGTIVGTSDSQTLTNKTLTSPLMTTPQINDTSADHQYVFGVSELAADRTVTLPLLTGNDTFVFANHAQTLDNKTIDCGTFS
jgi:hypothetical protein